MKDVIAALKIQRNRSSNWAIRIKNICRRWKGQWIYFSPTIAVGDFICATILRKSNSKIKHRISQSYYKVAQNLIEDKYRHVINGWRDVENEATNIEENCSIFIFWWQGVENLPGICSYCVESIKAHSGKHPVIIIDKNNYNRYTSIPAYITQKVEGGVISLTLFSDILRCALLCERGGIWIDSTCFMSDDFEMEIYKHSFYTIKHGDDWKVPVCKGYWATFMLASSRGNPLMGFMRDMFYEFWKSEKAFIVYLSLDLFLSIAYDNFSWARVMIDSIPYNNRDRDKLRELLIKSKGRGFEVYTKMVKDGTYIHKLTYKMFIQDLSD